MDKLKQLGIILGITFVAEIIYRFFKLPIPTSVYGLVLLFFLLQSRVLKLEQIEESGNFLLISMPIFFVAPGVNLMNIFDEVKPILFQALLLILISTVIVTVITGKISDYILRKEINGE